RIIEEIEKFSARNIRPIVEVPEKRGLLEPPEAKPMFISRKTLDKVDEFLGMKISSWLVPDGATICEEGSSSEGSFHQQANDEAVSKSHSKDSLRPETDPHLDASYTEPVPNPDLGKLVENNRELTFYQPVLPLPVNYKCSCVDCWRNVRTRKPPSRRMRSRRTLLSSDNFRCKVTRNRSHSDMRVIQDPWANSDLERSSHIRSNKRIYSNRFFRKKVSVKNVLKLCSKVPGWHKPITPPETLNITAQDCNEHERMCLAMCLNAGDFTNQPKADFEHSPSNPECQIKCQDLQKDKTMPSEHKHSRTSNDRNKQDSYLTGLTPPENSYKSESLPSYKYNSSIPFSCFENSQTFACLSPYSLPLSQLQFSSTKPQCNFSTVNRCFDHGQMSNVFNSTKYITCSHTMTWPTYQLPSVHRQSCGYFPENHYSSRRSSSTSHHCRSCPKRPDPNSCYSSPILPRYNYTPPTTSWRSAISISSPYINRSFNPRRHSSMRYCSGCDMSSSPASSFRSCAGHFNFSIHNYV
ncbi:unnamed protein product, partial [Candidula unifasciata]